MRYLILKQGVETEGLVKKNKMAEGHGPTLWVDSNIMEEGCRERSKGQNIHASIPCLSFP